MAAGLVLRRSGCRRRYGAFEASGVHRGDLGAPTDLKFGVDVRQIIFHGFLAQVQTLRDLLVGEAPGVCGFDRFAEQAGVPVRTAGGGGDR